MTFHCRFCTTGPSLRDKIVPGPEPLIARFNTNNANASSVPLIFRIGCHDCHFGRFHFLEGYG